MKKRGKRVFNLRRSVHSLGNRRISADQNDARRPIKVYKATIEGRRREEQDPLLQLAGSLQKLEGMHGRRGMGWDEGEIESNERGTGTTDQESG